MLASCGFGDELERVAPPSMTVEEALRAPEEARKRLAPDLGTFYERIGLASVLDDPTRTSLEDLLMSLHGQKRIESNENEHFARLGLKPGHFLFAQWMGLVQPTSSGTWEVPPLYLDLLLA